MEVPVLARRKKKIQEEVPIKHNNHASHYRSLPQGKYNWALAQSLYNFQGIGNDSRNRVVCKHLFYKKEEEKGSQSSQGARFALLLITIQAMGT
jgi:hypothetical protein